ncbi:MAG: SAM-dependent methyltransferase [Myxococcota bacterium]|jgi:SAM-dependent methyltransferase
MAEHFSTPRADDPRVRFSSTVGNYVAYRPGYPDALVQWIGRLTERSSGQVVDLGCGTGLSSRGFARAGYEVIGVEPNPDMLEAARAGGGGANLEYVRAEAAATGLDDHSVDIVVSGQAFHWFTLDEVLPELQRILRPGGWVVPFWNLRSQRPGLMQDYVALLRTLPSYRDTPKGPGTIAALRQQASVVSGVEATFGHHQSFDRAGLIGRAWSSSYVTIALSDPYDAARFNEELRALFDRYAQNGRVTFVYATRAFAFQLTTPIS